MDHFWVDYFALASLGIMGLGQPSLQVIFVSRLFRHPGFIEKNIFFDERRKVVAVISLSCTLFYKYNSSQSEAVLVGIRGIGFVQYSLLPNLG
jgi:hypothetical protein